MKPSHIRLVVNEGPLCASFYTKGESSWVCVKDPHNDRVPHHFVTTKDTHLPTVARAVRLAGIDRLTNKRPLIRRNW